MPGTNESPDESRPHPVGAELGAQAGPSLASLTFQAFQLRSHQHHALHPVEAALQYHRASAEIPGSEGHGGCGFAEAEAHYRAGAQGLRLSEIPQLPQQLRELSRLGDVDRAGRKALRKWAKDSSNRWKGFKIGGKAFSNPLEGPFDSPDAFSHALKAFSKLMEKPFDASITLSKPPEDSNRQPESCENRRPVVPNRRERSQMKDQQSPSTEAANDPPYCQIPPRWGG